MDRLFEPTGLEAGPRGLGFVATGLHRVSSLTIETDAMTYPGRDRVFPLFDDENVLLVRVLAQLKPRVGVDVGTGSGLLALALAANGTRSLGIDINPRALLFARRNAARNRLAAQVRFAEGDVVTDMAGLLSEHGSERIDLVVSNPPFVALPHTYPFHLAGHAGPDGMGVIRPLILLASQHLSADGALLFSALSLETDAGPLVAAEARSHFANVRVERIYPESIGLERFYAPFRPGRDIDAHLERLRRMHVRSVGYYLLSCASFSLPEYSLPPIIEEQFGGTWEARARRYRRWNELNGSAT